MSGFQPQIQIQGEPTPQSQPLLGHEREQIQNVAGGYCFQITDKERVKRFLCLGTELGYYRANPQYRKFSRSEVQAIDRLIANGHGDTVVNCIKEISIDGRACRQHPLLYALAVCARSNSPNTKHAAYSILNDVCRIPTDLFRFIKYCEDISGNETGWGRAHRLAISKWYKQFTETDPNSRKHPTKLAYLVTKYKRRNKLSHKDVIRLAHVRSKNKPVRMVIQYALGKEMEEVESSIKASEEVEQFIQAVETVKRCKYPQDEKTLCEMIAFFQLSREHVPTPFLNSVKVWETLFRLMPMTAMIRSLGKMTSLGMHYHNDFWVQLIEEKLGDDILLAKARIHPLHLLVAIKHYEMGITKKKKLSWTPHPRITQALQNAFVRLTKIIPSTGKRYLMAVSVGENMDQRIGGSTMKASEAAAAMIFSTVQTENVEVILFLDSIDDAYTAKVTKSDSLDTIENKLFGIPRKVGLAHMKHDLSVPFIWAASRKELFDAVIVFTDSITSCGHMHPAEAVKQYAQYMGTNDIRVVVVAMTSNKYTIAAPDDPNTLDVIGFDTHTPSLIMEFIGRFEQRHILNEEIFLHEEEDMVIDIHP